MRLFDLLKLSMRMFKARTMRTLLTILGMSVGIAAIIFLVSLGYGLQRTLLQKITTSDALVTLDVTLKESGDAIKLDNSVIETLKTVPNVVDVIPVLELSGQGKFDNVTLDVNTISSSVSLLKSEGVKINYGRLFNADDREALAPRNAGDGGVQIIMRRVQADNRARMRRVVGVADVGGNTRLVHGEHGILMQDGRAHIGQFTQLLVSDGADFLRALNIAGGQDEFLPSGQLLLAVLEFAQADLRAFGIQHCRNGNVKLLAQCAQLIQTAFVFRVIAMRKIEACNIHPVFQQLAQNAGLVGRRPQSTYNFSFAHKYPS